MFVVKNHIGLQGDGRSTNGAPIKEALEVSSSENVRIFYSIEEDCLSRNARGEEIYMKE